MELITCEYCGTSYDANLRQCPLCGKAAEPAPAEPIVLQADGSPKPKTRSRGGKRLAKNRKRETAAPGAAPSDNPYAIPKGMMKAICIILGVAVLAGAAFAIYNLKWFAPKEPAADATLQTPDTTQGAETAQPDASQPQESQYMNEEDYTPKPEEQQPEQPAAPVTCSALSLSTSSITFEEPEQFYGITYTREPADCTEEVTFSSDNESIATVNQQGKIVAVNAGSAVITARCGTQTATCLVTCDFSVIDEEIPAEEFKLNNVDMTFFTPGEQFTLSVKNAPEDAAVTYVSADESVAAVTSGGTVTAMGSGTTTVTVTVEGYDEPLKCIVRCNLSDSAEDTTASGSYTISHADVTMSLMGEYFKLRLQDSNGDSVSGVAWASSDSSVCTVDASGVVTAVGKGTATVSTTYGGATYQCIVRCNLS